MTEVKNLAFLGCGLAPIVQDNFGNVTAKLVWNERIYEKFGTVSADWFDLATKDEEFKATQIFEFAINPDALRLNSLNRGGSHRVADLSPVKFRPEASECVAFGMNGHGAMLEFQEEDLGHLVRRLDAMKVDYRNRFHRNSVLTIEAQEVRSAIKEVKRGLDRSDLFPVAFYNIGKMLRA